MSEFFNFRKKPKSLLKIVYMKPLGFARKEVFLRLEKDLYLLFDNLRFMSRKIIKRYAYEFLIVIPFLIFLSIILNFRVGKTPLQISHENVLLQPQNISLKNVYLQQMLSEGELKKAKVFSDSFLASPLLKRQIDYKIQEPEILSTQILHWTAVVSEFPNYRDAFVKLAILNWKLGRDFDARRYMETATSLDQNNPQLKLLWGSLGGR